MNAPSTYNYNKEKPVKSDFAAQYFHTRLLENRILSNEEVRMLPSIPASNTHFKEWKIRKQSTKKFICYLSGKNLPLKILEVGCGNGWLSAAMAGIKESKVKGIDVNEFELEQAKQVFSKISNVEYCLTPFDDDIKDELFDIIVFAASLQYFKSVQSVIDRAKKLLSPNGEIHIIDTHFYTPIGIPMARKRTQAYYASIGFPEMSTFYFHHSLNDLSPFRYKIFFRPGFFRRFFLLNSNPFHWIRIK